MTKLTFCLKKIARLFESLREKARTAGMRVVFYNRGRLCAKRASNSLDLPPSLAEGLALFPSKFWVAS
ncbi:hypothetical protein MPNT_370002 [Candidatus Methylacidithermus pantelleriae]|uniref:Uncharacterized protein n=1 Tax=Candidatus Methylacidithermus pantelleriae TaxID=2744239 RepID=A0A8J2FWP2_9BACT|nr:hypothetical protein MPNT_370002 [Candidatus Methylacidithermus pantelleriae]